MNNLTYDECVLNFNSADYHSGDTNAPTFKLEKPLRLGRNISIISATIPLSQYNISAANNNNTLKVQRFNTSTNTVSTATLTVPDGSYGADGLAFALSAELYTATGFGSGFSFNLNSSTLRMEFTVEASLQATNGVRVHSDSYGAKTLAAILGYDTYDANYADFYTADSVIDFDSGSAFYIHSKALSKCFEGSRYYQNGNSNNSIIGKIVWDVNLGGIVTWSQLTGRTTFRIMDIMLDQIDFEIRDKYDNLIDLNGLSWSIEIKTYVNNQ